VTEDAPKSIVEVDLVAEGDNQTAIEVRHQHVPAYFDTAALTHRWEQALEKLAALLA